jgi:SpoVK/Ycf46/Vps4 family AAA+-type ATPase
MPDTDFKKQVDIALRARITLLVIASIEEERVVQAMKEVCERWNPPRQCLLWDIAEGLCAVCGNRITAPAKDPLQALDAADRSDENAVILLRDFHEFWNNPHVKRKLRNAAQRYKYSRRTIVVITPSLTVPAEIRDEAVTLHFLPPSAEELGAELDVLLNSSSIRNPLTKTGREKLVQAALGMTLNQARRSFSKALVAHGRLDDRNIEEIIAEKKDVLSQSQALEFHSATETADNVGGLSVLKEWLTLREKAFTREARDYGLPAPKGIALIGIPGTGKSLTAKMIAGLWRLPLLRLDAGALFGSLVGESEERTRRALTLAETIAPCILWIDEIEKAFSFGTGDAGTSQRVFGSILTWMQEKTAPCFVVATANNIAALPPELLRKGRFDEIFFLDLPNLEERREIFAVHLKKRRHLLNEFDLGKLASASDGFVGAEIEQAVIDAMYVAFNQGMRRITTQDLLANLQRQVPLSRSQREIVHALRTWIQEGRAVSASKVQTADADISARIELDPFQRT